MGFFDIIKKQFVDVIEWTESEDPVLSCRYPMIDQEIQNGAQLTVRESQMALFVNEGKIADLFNPGQYTLTTKTLPVMTSLQNWDKLFNSPFKSDVYFFSTRLQIDQKWGTATPITVRDKELGPIRIRAYGIYSYQLMDPKTFYLKISGSRERYTTEDLEGQLRSVLLTVLASRLGKSEVNFIDMAATQVKFSEAIKDAFSPELVSYGLRLENLQLQSVSLPEELQKHFDEKASRNIVGNLKDYAQFQAAASIPVAAANEGGIAGAGAGLGAGLSIGQAMSASLGGSGVAAKEEDPTVLLEKLHELLKKGVITQGEFDVKKSELLRKIT